MENCCYYTRNAARCQGVRIDSRSQQSFSLRDFNFFSYSSPPPYAGGRVTKRGCFLRIRFWRPNRSKLFLVPSSNTSITRGNRRPTPHENESRSLSCRFAGLGTVHFCNAVFGCHRCPRHMDSPKSLTHPLTHYTIGAHGNSGHEALIQQGIVDKKGQKCLQYQAFDLVRRICNQQVGGSSPSTSSSESPQAIRTKFNMGEFPSGQRGQTVNLLSMTSVVRIHLPPPSPNIQYVRRFSYFCRFSSLFAVNCSVLRPHFCG